MKKQRDVLQARKALMAGGGNSTATITGRLGVTIQTVYFWRGRVECG